MKEKRNENVSFYIILKKKRINHILQSITCGFCQQKKGSFFFSSFQTSWISELLT